LDGPISIPDKKLDTSGSGRLFSGDKDGRSLKLTNHLPCRS
jgi:hypothetical protein